MAKHSGNGLVRELGLMEALAIGLGTMIGAGIFVLSAEAARRAGPGAALSYGLAGLICLPIALTISELATGMPKAGGSYYLISRALGPLAGTVVGIGNWLGLVFATGFYLIGFAQYVAYFLPIPTFVTATVAGVGFIFLNYRGSKLSGRVQNVIVVVLVLILAVFVIRGLFSLEPALHEPFVPSGWGAVAANVGLIIVSFTGFEKISTIAEEIKNPGRNLPLAIVGSVVIATLLYMSVLFVATGILSYEIIADYQAPLVEATKRFMGNAGIFAVSLGALLATASSANAAIMASSRINFAMGRDDILPDWFSMIHPRHLTPHRSIVVTGIMAVMLALSGQATVLAEISSALFMVSYALLVVSLLVLRRTKPSWYRPAFRAPLFPWLSIVGGLGALAVIGTMAPLSQIAGMGLAALSLVWYVVWGRRRTRVKGELAPWLERERPLEHIISEISHTHEISHKELLVSVANPATIPALMSLAASLARGDNGSQVVALNIVSVPLDIPLYMAQEYLDAGPRFENGRDPWREGHQEALEMAVHLGANLGIDVQTRLQAAYGIASGIVAGIKSHTRTGLVLLGWRGPFALNRIGGSPDQAVVQAAPSDVAILLSRSDDPIRKILVPCGGGPHARLGLRLAYRLVKDNPERSITVLRIAPDDDEVDVEAEEGAARFLIECELGQLPPQVRTRVVCASEIIDGIVNEAAQGYDLLVIGASEQWFLRNWLFGGIPDVVAQRVPCSVLLVKKHEPTPLSWFRRAAKGRRKLEEPVCVSLEGLASPENSDAPATPV
ncbi:MAG: amino acid permease [Anaerolineae bacterium]|nr:amino acid permease [Anaerolineae bacterium]